MSKIFHNFFYGKRVLITGHTGFKGAWLSTWLLKLGAHVIGYSLKPPTKPNCFDICKLGDSIVSVIDDIRNYDRLQSVIKKYQPEIVFHLAAQSLVRLSYKKPVETFATNVIGTVNLLEACRSATMVRAIVNVTSDKCYDNKEWTWGYREIDPVGGYDPYSCSKACAELVTNAYVNSFFNPEYCQEHEVSVATARAGNVIGGGDWAQDRLIPDCVNALFQNQDIVIRNPDAVRPWQHVLEPLYGYLLLAKYLYQKDGNKYIGAWNFGPDSEDGRAVRWIADSIIRIWGHDAKWIDAKEGQENVHEAHYLKLDCSKAKSRLNWHPQWKLNFALKKSIEWYKSYFEHEDMVKVTLNQIKEYENDIQKEAR